MYRARVRALIVAGVALAWLASPAGAAATPVALRYEAPEACPPASAFRAGVDGRTGRAQWVAPGAETVTLEVVVEVSDGGAQGRLVVRERGRPPPAPREVADATCATVVDALALVAALAIDPQASLAPSAPGPLAPPATAPPPPEDAGLTEPRDDVIEAPAGPIVDAGPIADAGPIVAPPTSPAWRWSLGAQLGLTSALGPGALQVQPIYVDVRRVEATWTPSLHLGFAVLVPRDVTSAVGSAELTRFAGQLGLCPVGLDVEGFRLAPCAGIELGMLEARGLTVDNPRTARELWAGALLTLRSSARVGGPVSIDVEAGAAIPFTRPRARPPRPRRRPPRRP